MASIQYTILIATLLVAVFRFRKLTPAQWGITALIALTLAVEIISNHLAHKYGNNLWMSHVYSPLMILILIWTFDREYHIPTTYRPMIYLSPLLFSSIDSFMLEPYQSHLAGYGQILQSLIMVILLLAYTNRILEIDLTEKLYKFPLFTVLAAHSVYNISSLVYLGLFNYQYHNGVALPTVYFKIHLVMNYILYLIILSTFFFHKTTQSKHATVRSASAY